MGYRPVAVDSVGVRLGRTTTLGDVTLETQAYELGELVVTAGRRLTCRTVPPLGVLEIRLTPPT